MTALVRRIKKAEDGCRLVEGLYLILVRVCILPFAGWLQISCGKEIINCLYAVKFMDMEKNVLRGNVVLQTYVSYWTCSLFSVTSVVISCPKRISYLLSVDSLSYSKRKNQNFTLTYTRFTRLTFWLQVVLIWASHVVHIQKILGSIPPCIFVSAN